MFRAPLHECERGAKLTRRITFHAKRGSFVSSEAGEARAASRSRIASLALAAWLGVSASGPASAQCGDNPWLAAAGPGNANATDLDFVPDAGYRLVDAHNPSPAVDPDTGDVWLYYADGPDWYRTVSAGGITFPAGTSPTDSKLDPRATPLPDGSWRRYAYVPSVQAFRSHASADGIVYAPDDGTVHYNLQPVDEGWVGVYTVFTNTSEEVVLVYLGAQPGTARRAISSDGGDSFAFDQANLLGDEAYKDCKWIHWDPRALILPDGRVRLFTMVQGPNAALPGQRAVGTVFSFISDDGSDAFSLEPGMRLESSDFTDLHLWSLNDPWVVELPDGRFRMYVAAKASDDAAGNNPRWVIVSATTRLATPLPALAPPSLLAQFAILVAIGVLNQKIHERRREGGRC